MNAFLTRFDELAHPLFAAAGLATTATYTPPAGAAVIGVRVYQDDGVQVMGENANVVTQLTRIALLRADVAAPEEGGAVAIGSNTYRLDALLKEDESLTWWTVIRE